jgi:hypothetical protein
MWSTLKMMAPRKVSSNFDVSYRSHLASMNKSTGFDGINPGGIMSAFDSATDFSFTTYE